MRLERAKITGIGRLVDATLKLDQKLIAIVGPNEAGKSTALKALALPYSMEPLDPSELSRAANGNPSETVITTLIFRLEPNDQALLEHFEFESSPTHLYVSRTAESITSRLSLSPPTQTIHHHIREALSETEALRNAAELSNYEGQLDPQDDLMETLPPYESALEDIKAIALGSSFDRPLINECKAQLNRHLSIFKHKHSSLVTPTNEILKWLDLQISPKELEKTILQNTPELIFFSEDDRQLSSSYNLDQYILVNTPQALANFANFADIDLNELVEATQRNQVSRRDTIRNKANRLLSERFKNFWRQSDLDVQINIEHSTLRISVTEEGVHSSLLSERSAGLRMFLTLTTFLYARRSNRPVILLIDEAESHLHIDAQADLIQMFATQNHVDKIIYTTHSPACLPPDLGVGIRAIVPDSEETSRIENQFWTLPNGRTSSLMFALGASAAAFTPARCAVICEGATDMIMLPTLIRAATGLESLPYQATPGLSEMKAADYRDFDYHAAKIAYLVDGDDGGKALADKLRKEVPDKLVISLTLPGIENTLDETCFKALYLQLLTEYNNVALPTDIPSLPEPTRESWPSFLAKWAQSTGLRAPSKRELASRLVESKEISLNPAGKAALQYVHASLIEAFALT